jgi:hypothetical protein
MEKSIIVHILKTEDSNFREIFILSTSYGILLARFTIFVNEIGDHACVGQVLIISFGVTEKECNGSVH